MSLEAQAVFWLRFHKSCQMIITQRSPMRHGGVPDVLGITHARYCIEVECKRTMSDFRANQNKICVRNREAWIKRWPKQFFFAVPVEMEKRALSELPDWAGLLIGGDTGRLLLCREAPTNRESVRLTPKQYVHAVKLMTNELHWGRSRDYHKWAARELSETDYQI